MKSFSVKIIPFPAILFLPWIISDCLSEDDYSQFELPEALTETQFEALRSHSPFVRVLDFSESIQLTGFAVIDGKQVATVREREKGKSFVISGEPNEEGWKMVKVNPDQDLENATATIAMQGGELVTLQFDAKQLHPESKSQSKIEIPRGPDRRPEPTKEERRKFGEWVRGRMSKLSDDQKKKIGKIMHEKMTSNPKLSDRQKGEVFVKILDQVESGK